MEQFVQQTLLPWAIKIVIALAIFFIGKIVAKWLTKFTCNLLEKSKMDGILINFLSSIIYSILLLVVAIAALNQLGIDTTSLVALVGAAGLAVGLALKDSLQNFAAGVLLIVFRPFKAGDFIDAAGVMGTVEKINVFNSILKTPDNREIIVPNASIYSGSITNFSAKATRRIDLIFGISYDSDIKLAKQIMQQLVAADERILKDPETQIAVAELADSSVNFVCRPWVKKEDYWAVRFELIENVKLAFDEQGISIPFPQMDVHVKQEANEA